MKMAPHAKRGLDPRIALLEARITELASSVENLTVDGNLEKALERLTLLEYKVDALKARIDQHWKA